MRWDISETRRLIEQHHGSEQLRSARYCLRSVTERLRHAQYHFQEAKSLLKENIDDRLEAESIHMLAWPAEPDKWNALDHYLMKVEANMIACAQAIHSIADNLAHVVHFALGLNFGPLALKERDISIHSVAAVLAARAPKYAEVEHSLRTFLAESSFATVSAIVNVTKHRGFVESRLSIEPPDHQGPYAIEFGAFAYRGEKYPEREIEEVLAPAYAVASRAVVDTGNAINLVLSR